MTNLLIKLFVGCHNDPADTEMRRLYGILGGAVGIVCNILLFLIKITVGLLSGSIAVISDGFNNLSDLGSSVVSVVGAKVGGKVADTEHPYGHGRAEYISALIISFLILFFGLELFKSSVTKFFKPQSVVLSMTSVLLLCLSSVVKLWMWKCNKKFAKATSSDILYAAARDSLNDVFSTAAVILSAVSAHFTDLPTDAAVGCGVSLLILWTGFEIAKSTVNRLLGTAPTAELADKIENIITTDPEVFGIHDLMIHDYGPGRKIASVHAEVSSSLSVCDIHYIIDKAERAVTEETGVDIVIHMDPVACVLKPLSEKSNNPKRQ